VSNGPTCGVVGLGAGFRGYPVEGDLAQVPDPGRELQAEQVEQAEVDQGDPVGVGGVFGDRDVGGVAEDFVEHVVRLALGRDDDLRSVGGVLVGDVGVGREDLTAVDGHLPPGRRLAPHREPLPVAGGQGARTEHHG